MSEENLFETFLKLKLTFNSKYNKKMANSATLFRHYAKYETTDKSRIKMIEQCFCHPKHRSIKKFQGFIKELGLVIPEKHTKSAAKMIEYCLYGQLA